LASRVRIWGPAAAWAAVLFLLSALPDLRAGPDLVPFGDKVVHAVLYATFGATLGLGWSRAPAPVRHGVLLVVGTLYAGTDEWHQMYVPGRTPDVADWVADVGGLLVGYGTTVKLLGRKNDREIDEEST
jgi:VanZ family protein